MKKNEIVFQVPAYNQGQIVEISYAQVDGLVIRKIYDQSDMSVEYFIADADDDDEGDYKNGGPHPADEFRRVDESVVMGLIENL